MLGSSSSIQIPLLKMQSVWLELESQSVFSISQEQYPPIKLIEYPE